MKISILQCDDVLEKFQPEFGSYNKMIQHMFDAINGEFDFKSFDCQLGQYPEDIDAYNFYITTGSKSGVYEEKPWIGQLIKFIKLLYYKQKN